MTFPLTHPALARALAARDYSVPTAVQTAVLDANAAGRDLLVSAQTGSGKTVAFGLAMAATLLGEDERFGRADAPAALIIAPTRELAMQVQRELSWLYAETGARVIPCVGGMDARAEARQLRQGADIVVGTPGRLRDHLERGQLDLSQLKAVVLDEADEMLDLGFREELEFILDATPEGRRTLLFSATMPREIEALARRYQRDAVRIETVRRDEQHSDIEYQAISVAPADIENAVVNILRLHEVRAAIVFCSTREAVKRLHARLQERGFSAVALSGELTQGERTQALKALRDARARVLVATDVAARGLDLPDLSLVIHADLPHDAETLLHRSGRTGRAGRKGLCTLIVPFNRRRKAELLLRAARLKVTWPPAPTPEEIRARDQERFLAAPVFTEAPSDDEIALARALQAGRSADEIAIALVRMHQAGLPAPETMAPDLGPPPRDERWAAKRDERRQGRPDRTASETGERRPPRMPRNDGREMVWFRLNIGRERNADPRWLLPLICESGGVTESDIGAIKIFDRDTRFEIAAELADKFAEAIRTTKPKQGHISRVGAERSAERAPVDEARDGHSSTHRRASSRDGGSDKRNAPDFAQQGDRPKPAWRERSDTKPGKRPHRKGPPSEGARAAERSAERPPNAKAREEHPAARRTEASHDGRPDKRNSPDFAQPSDGQRPAWRERTNAKPGKRPHRKGAGEGTHANGMNPRPRPKGGPAAPGKFGPKKKNRAPAPKA